MTSQRDDRVYGTVGKARRSPPGGDSQSSGFFQTGQGGRTVLPPLSSAFPTSSRSPGPANYPNTYSQPRSSPAKAEHSVSAYNQWPVSATPTTAASQHSSAYYEHYDSRYQQAQAYPTYQSRASPPIPADPHGSRKLPPLSVSSTAVRDDRWQGASYGSVGPHISNYADIRSPTATYPPEYAQYQHQTSYSYPPVPDPRSHPGQLPSMHHSHQMSMGGMYPHERGLPAQVEAHGPSPYARGTVTNTVLTQEPASVLVAEEPVIKKKRKRADVAQLKVLNETYSRTAFPSTEERADLAKKLDMSARSVQIWFQNKRQSMRQTTRQASSSVTSGSHQPFSMSSQSEDVVHSSYGGSLSPTTAPAQPYLPRSDTRPAVGPDGRAPPPPRREDDSRKWSSGRY
ncbi:homeobox-domain-containing protein [Gyrodon lividus]|nr:homeobox-domain-containing protein [Gyrodon lividus]